VDFQKIAGASMNLENFKVEFKYVRRARRAILRVKPGGIIRVSMPYGVKRSEIENWIKTKVDWILEKHKMLEAAHTAEPLTFSEGSLLPFQGGQVRVKFSGEKNTPAVQLKGESELLISGFRGHEDENRRRKKIIEWYQAQTFKQAKERVEYYCTILNVKPRSVSVKNYRSRWGACSSKGDLIFNWQIILFEPEMFDYVVAHEVCHLLEMNHGPKFYAWLGKLGFDKKVNKKFKNLKNIF
jgi:predicted metal-dependent hydrolase